jgi:hypothetical protein
MNINIGNQQIDCFALPKSVYHVSCKCHKKMRRPENQIINIFIVLKTDKNCKKM